MAQSRPASTPATESGRGLSLSSLLGAASLVMAFFVLSRLTGIVRDMVIVAEFDLSANLDAYQAAFRIPDMIFEVVAGGALGSAFIPTFTRHLHREGAGAAWDLFSQALNAITLVLTLLAVGGILGAPWLIRTFLAPGFPPEQQMLVANIMRWLLLGTVVYGASGLCMGALNTMQHFALPALAPAMRNLAMIGSALWLTAVWDIYALAAGAVIGSLLHLLVQMPGLLRYGVRFRLALNWRHAGLRHVVLLMLPRMLGLMFIHINLIVNTNLASRLPDGSVSALEYGFRLMMLPVALFAQALAIVAFPTFAAQAEVRDFENLRRTIRRMVRLVFFLAMPCAMAMYLLRTPLIEVLYERGSFTAESTRLVAYALQFFVPGLIAYAVVEIMVRAYYALHDTRTPVLAGVLIVLLNIALSVWWVNHFGVAGLALANSVATTVEMGLLIWWLRRRVPTLSRRSLLNDAWHSFVATLGMGITLKYFLDWVGLWTWLPPGLGGSLIVLVTGAGVALSSYLVLNQAFGNLDWLVRWRRA